VPTEAIGLQIRLYDPRQDGLFHRFDKAEVGATIGRAATA
jgi:hypothetical protein